MFAGLKLACYLFLDGGNNMSMIIIDGNDNLSKEEIEEVIYEGSNGLQHKLCYSNEYLEWIILYKRKDQLDFNRYSSYDSLEEAEAAFYLLKDR